MPNLTRTQRRARYAARRAQGLCVDCPLPSVRFSRCACCRALHREHQRVWERAYRQRHRQAIRERSRAWYAAHRDDVKADQLARYHQRKQERQAA